MTPREIICVQKIISLRTVVHDGLGCYATSRDYIAARSAEANRSQCIVQLVVQKNNASITEALNDIRQLSL